MSFPSTDLDIIVEVYLGADPTADPSTWPTATDLSSRLMRRPITIRRGRGKNQKTLQSGSCTFWLENTDGALTPRLATSTYFPDWDLGVPMRVSVDNVGPNPPYVRFTGFLADCKAVMVPGVGGVNISAVQVTLGGVWRRISQGAVAKSSPYRYLAVVSPTPVAAWTLEDGQLVSGGSALYGDYDLLPWTGTHPSGAAVSYPQWATGDLGPWLPPVVSRSGSSGLTVLAAAVAMPAFTTTWTVDLMYASGTDAGHDTVDGISATVDINPSYLTGGATGWPQLIFVPDVQEIQVAMNGEPEVSTVVLGLYDGIGHHIRWTVSQSGGNVTWTVYVDGVSVQASTTSGAMTLTAIRQIGLSATGQGGSQLAQGYVAIWTTPPTLSEAAAAALGHPGERSHDRVERLCAEEGIPYSGNAALSNECGRQQVGDVTEVLQDAEKVDHGMIVEDFAWGLNYRASSQRENLSPVITIDLATYRTTSGTQADVLTPVRNDQRLRNEWTINRTGGSFATAKDEASQAKRGRYNDADTVNVADDTRILDEAQWRVHEGTFDGLRYDTVPLDIAANL